MKVPVVSVNTSAFGRDRLKPAFDAASLQRVVVHRLPVRPVRRVARAGGDGMHGDACRRER